MKLRFSHSLKEADNIYSLFFVPEKPFVFTAGQYIELTIKHDHPDSRGEKRWFTLSSSPNDKELSITTKITTGSSSFKKALLNLQAGEEISMTGPMGDFVLPKLLQTPLIFVAGGIGITPYNSILRWLSETNEERPIKFIYGVGSEDEIIFQETFDRLKQHVTIVVEHPSASWGGERGRLNAELILGLTQPEQNSLIYVSGPEIMVETLEKDLKKLGIKPGQLVLDFFPNYLSI